MRTSSPERPPERPRGRKEKHPPVRCTGGCCAVCPRAEDCPAREAPGIFQQGKLPQHGAGAPARAEDRAAVHHITARGKGQGRQHSRQHEAAGTRAVRRMASPWRRMLYCGAVGFPASVAAAPEKKKPAARSGRRTGRGREPCGEGRAACQERPIALTARRRREHSLQFPQNSVR